MLKKMRRRMIALAMFSFFVVMAIIILVINIINYINVTRDADHLLYDLVKMEGSGSFFPSFEAPPFPEFPELPEQGVPFMIRFFIVRYDPNGNYELTSANYNSPAEEDAIAAYAERICNGSSDKGYIGIYRYHKERSGEDTLIAFLDVTRDRLFMRSLLLASLLVALGSLLLVFLLVFLLSNRMIRPFVRNMEQQKQFITDAGHELKTPLTSISTSLDVIMLEHGEDEWISNIRTQTDRMIQMVGDLVTLSRLDESSAVSEKELFSLSDAIWETIEGFQPMIKAREKDFSADITENVMMTGDRIAIQKMLAALLDNAVRYSDEKGTIRISLKKRSSHIELTIFNTCQFDDPPDTKKLFERFYRPDESRSKETGGTGVGLAIARAAAQTNGGTIHADCPDGRSMTIQVTF